MKKNTAQPANPFHPGEILLEEFLEPGKIAQAAFARKIGWTKARLNEFVRGKRGVTADAALDLGEALGTSARLWRDFACPRRTNLSAGLASRVTSLAPML